MSAVLLFSAVLIGVGIFYYPELMKQLKESKAATMPTRPAAPPAPRAPEVVPEVTPEVPKAAEAAPTHYVVRCYAILTCCFAISVLFYVCVTMRTTLSL